MPLVAVDEITASCDGLRDRSAPTPVSAAGGAQFEFQSFGFLFYSVLRNVWQQCHRIEK